MHHPRTEVVALCDLLRERLDILGDELGVTARFVDLDEMIEQTRPDIVAIPTGTEFHHDLALRGIGDEDIAKDRATKGVILRSDECGFLNGIEVKCGGHGISPGRARRSDIGCW